MQYFEVSCVQRSCNWVTTSSKYLLLVLRVISLMMLHHRGIILFVALAFQSRMIIYAKYMWGETEIYPLPPNVPPHMICIKFRPFHLRRGVVCQLTWVDVLARPKRGAGWVLTRSAWTGLLLVSVWSNLHDFTLAAPQHHPGIVDSNASNGGGTEYPLYLWLAGCFPLLLAVK